jgi:hypothetical protein
MGWQPGQDDGKGETPGPGPGLPGGHEVPLEPRLPGGPASAGSPGRGGVSLADPRLAGFANGGHWDSCPPSAALAAALEAASGPGWRCPGASRDEMTGLLRQWQAIESWAAAGELGVLRALVRDEGQPLPGAATTATCPTAGRSR